VWEKSRERWGDVIAAIGAALSRGGPDEHLELAGPESLSRRALTHRAAAAVGRRTRVVSLPLALGMALAAVFEAISSHPPVTRAMLGVLDHDDQVDPLPAARTLGLALTPLDQTLSACLRGPGR